MIMVIKLVLAHLLGDFVFQPNSWVKAKEEKKLQAWQLYAHVLIHGLLVFLLIFLFSWDWEAWRIALWITLAHFVIDSCKISFQKENTKRIWFFIDQFAHFVSIYWIWLWFQAREISLEPFTNAKSLLLVTCVIFLTQPVSIIIKVLISKWTPQIGDVDKKALKDEADLESLKSAGKYIGILERVFVFVFILTDHWQAIGFLIAAKSIFRFSYSKEAVNRKLTEYILIGTLVSFGLAILTGLIYLKLSGN